MSATPGKPASRAGGVVRLFGRLLSLAIIAAAGVGGWIGVDQFALAESDTVPLPDLGDGLPTARLNEPPPWRSFQLTKVQPTQEEQYWFDLDEWRIRSQVTTDTRVDTFEIDGDVGFSQSGVDGEWVEQDAATTRTIASFVMGGIGPYLLTDLVQPGALGFTTLELEGTSRGERVYEVSVDAETLQLEHPLAYNRWVTATRIVGEPSAVYRIRVRPDGYVVRIDDADSAVIWSDLPDGVPFGSPLAASIPTGSTTSTPSATPTPDATPDPTLDPTPGATVGATVGSTPPIRVPSLAPSTAPQVVDPNVVTD